MLLSFALGAALLTSASAFAGENSSCHFHGSKPAEEATVLQCAAKRIEMLISRGKIDAAWKGKRHDTVEVVEAKTGKEWKLTYSDPQAKDATKTKLYLYFTQVGNFLAANHSGK
ncbi:MAG: hypothetical protein IOD12_03855 [Silvanigrellales bacterium]|nr:hypothetical protein [Silvanigrellales bacterium]